jgi:hypothetical protein
MAWKRSRVRFPLAPPRTPRPTARGFVASGAATSSRTTDRRVACSHRAGVNDHVTADDRAAARRSLPDDATLHEFRDRAAVADERNEYFHIGPDEPRW